MPQLMSNPSQFEQLCIRWYDAVDTLPTILLWYEKEPQMWSWIAHDWIAKLMDLIVWMMRLSNGCHEEYTTWSTDGIIQGKKWRWRQDEIEEGIIQWKTHAYEWLIKPIWQDHMDGASQGIIRSNWKRWVWASVLHDILHHQKIYTHTLLSWLA